MTRRMNHYGVLDSAELYRTIAGERYICWRSDATPENVAAYRAAGVRCAKRGAELFVREQDAEAAHTVDFEKG